MGTHIATAIEFVLRNCLGVAQGRRPGVSLTVVIITDGRTQDASQLPRASEDLHEVTDKVFVIGVSK